MRPSHHELPWIDQRLEVGFWDDRENRCAYMQWLGQQLGYSHTEDWYQVKTRDFNENHGTNLLGKYYGTILNALTEYIPKHDWKPWLFAGGVSSGFWQKQENQRVYLDWLFEQLDYSRPEDWYGISTKAFQRNGCGGLLTTCFRGSPIEAIQSVYPEYQLLTWKFNRCPNGYWQDDDNIHTYLEWLGKELGYSRPEDWYQISSKDFIENFGRGLLTVVFGGQPRKAAQFIFPNFDWKPWQFNQVPPNWWKNQENRKHYLDWLAKRIGYSRPEDWYEISRKIFSNNFGSGFLGFYGDSPTFAVTESFPEFQFKPWLFTVTKGEFWGVRENQRIYMDWLFEQLDYSEPEDWYGISKKAFEQNSGSALLNYFDNSPIKAVQGVYPEYQLLTWKFNRCPNGYWQDDDNIHTYLEWLGKELGYSRPEDWYQISRKDLVDNYGSSLFNNIWSGNARKAAYFLFPDNEWVPWFFNRVPRFFWQDEENCRNYMRWLEKELGIKKEEDWYRVQKADLVNNYGAGFYGQACARSIIIAVNYLYPYYPWNPKKFRAGLRSQKRLQTCVHEIYPDQVVRFNYLHPNLRFIGSNLKMEIDIFLPELNLGFEYQGEGHFIPIESWGGEIGLKKRKERDEEKRQACIAENITLVEVKYTWDGSTEKLKRLVREATKSRCMS